MTVQLRCERTLHKSVVESVQEAEVQQISKRHGLYYYAIPELTKQLVSHLSGLINSRQNYALHEKTPLHKIKCVVKSVLKATFDTPLITFDSRQR